MRRTSLFVLASLLSSVTALCQPVGPEFRVNSYTTGLQLVSALASDSVGDFVVVWQSRDQTDDGSWYGVFGQRYTSGGMPRGGEFRVNTYTTGGQEYPAVSSDAAGGFVVVWQSFGQDGFNYSVFGQRYASDGSPLGTEFRVNTYSSNDQTFPSVASDSSGGFVVVWQSNTNDLSGWGVFGQRYAAGGTPLGGEFRVNAYTTNDQRRPSIASDPSGNFVVAWHGDSQDGYGLGVFGQRYASGGAPLGPEFRVNTYTTGHQSSPSIASDSSGNFVVAWSGVGPSVAFSVFAQRYASGGAPRGGEFRVNTYTTGGPAYPSVSSDSAGYFVVVWQTAFQDGYDLGVFGQRYARGGPPLGRSSVSIRRRRNRRPAPRSSPIPPDTSS